jgi:hypothetical protein
VKSISLAHVEFLPRDLREGVLYVSEEYAVAGHLCACGCGNKVIVPLGPAEWKFHEKDGLPTLWPSIGNWQLPCRSHYMITEGQIDWAGSWSKEEVERGRQAEQVRREAYYDQLQQERHVPWWQATWNRILRLFSLVSAHKNDAKS